MFAVIPGLDVLVFAVPIFNRPLQVGCCQSISQSDQSNQSIDTQNKHPVKIQQTAANPRSIEQTRSPLYNHPHRPIHAPRKPKGSICTSRGTTPRPNPRSIRGPVEVLQGRAGTDQPNACKFGCVVHLTHSRQHHALPGKRSSLRQRCV